MIVIPPKTLPDLIRLVILQDKQIEELKKRIEQLEEKTKFLSVKHNGK